jgi:hypothetical protein
MALFQCEFNVSPVILHGLKNGCLIGEDIFLILEFINGFKIVVESLFLLSEWLEVRF